MKLYHGSNVEVKEPSLHYSAKNRDFGQGFYLTPDINQAKSWAIKKANSTQIGRPIVSIYEIDDSELNKLNMKKFEIADEEWFNYVLKNRIDKDYYDNYDVVIGPIANDGTYQVLNLYTRNLITKATAILELKSFKLKDQYTFKTEKAISKLSYKGVEY